ncbi:transcriptional repressor LexA [bacterium]|nr:transcriptional repressor LexA [bacterium]
MKPLTKRQYEILDFIRDYRLKYGYAPTLEEIKLHFSLHSVATVHKHLTQLEQKGFIHRDWNQSRSIRLEPEPSEVAGVEVPLLGLVAAGLPIEAIAGNETITIPQDMLGRRETYVLRVKGDSMIDEQIRDGDFLIVESRAEAENGDVVVALINNYETTVKKFYREPPGRIRLQPANPAMQPLFFNSDQVTIQGLVLGVLRKFHVSS